MNDPWDVKSVRQSGQYVSCMKINGVPLLPPVLSKECRKEMQYYKLLAKEVEKRISILQPYVYGSDSETSDKTDAPELPESEQSYELPSEDVLNGFNVNIDKIIAITSDKDTENYPIEHIISPPKTEVHNSITSNVMVVNATDSKANSPKFVIDLSLSINETGRNVLDSIKKSSPPPPPVDLPERDCDYSHKLKYRELLTEVVSPTKNRQKKVVQDVINFSFSLDKDVMSDPFSDVTLTHDGPSSLSSKSFTGSLNDLHTDSMRESQKNSKLIRQRSYTLLKPSPQLLAHLEVQSLNTGVDMSCISMSESLSNLSSRNKKRRSWDLESAKVKWSNMALELKQNNVKNLPNVNNMNKTVAKTITSRKPVVSPPKARSLAQEKPRQISSASKAMPKSEPLQKPKKPTSPVRMTPNRDSPKDHSSPKTLINQKKESKPSKLSTQLISESDDPATCVRELYEKIQKQQLLQMAGLVEKQKREQLMLQQVFEEQNNMLFKQLKTICPKSPDEIKEAWVEKQQEVPNRGPVSLSQVINHKSPKHADIYDTSVTSTLTNTHNYINQCDNVLKKSRDLSGSLKKQQMKSRSQNGNKIQSPSTHVEGSRTRTHSPNQRNTSRKLNYDTSVSTDRECELILTDRTNDTMADLNVTFPSDYSDECQPYNLDNTVINNVCSREVSRLHQRPNTSGTYCRSTDSAIRNMERTIQKSIADSQRTCNPNSFTCPPSPQQQEAATKIVAVAKGFLVRRLMATERVQGIVQTIKDALLCALQLHQDREGIRGADVDLHRRLIQQITAACYSLHDTFVASSAAERCAMIAADRSRRRSLAARPPHKPARHTNI